VNTNSQIARIVGILFIIGTVAGILSVVFTQSILDDSDYLVKVSENENQIILGSLLILTMGFALSMIPVFMYPIFRKYHEPLALGYVVFRGAIETVTYIASATVFLLLVTLSHEYVKAGTPDASYAETLGTLLKQGIEWISQIMAFVFGLGALIFYYLLYQTRLTPRWLSGWGLAAILLTIVAALLVMFDIIQPDSASQNLLSLPIFVQEMVLAVWLIVKGFNSSTIASESS
jgi:Domain of unknown function (DUF4386)